MLWPKKKKNIKSHGAKAVTKPYSKNAAYQKDFLPQKDFKKWLSSGTKEMILSDRIISDPTIFHKNFLSMVTRFYPAASAAVWTWKNLCTTKQEVKFTGSTDIARNSAKEITNALDIRITPIKTVKSGGLNFLTSLYFKYLFTYGRFAGILKLNPTMDRVEGFQIIDPFSVKFDKNREPWIQVSPNKLVKANLNTFYYYALEMDWDNPYGYAMLEAAWSMMKMAEEMMEDMKLSSSNAGLPRLHIKITQPQKIDGEEDNDYIDRISSYFNSYISQLSDIAPDDNFYSWDDVSVATVGGLTGGGGFVWRTNRQVFDEEILAAFHLFPWIVGKSTQTTKNWVRSQFDLLLAVVESLQEQATNFSNWINNTNLALHNVFDVRSNYTFERLRDPAAKDFALAQSFKLANVKNKILMGMISSDDGAREMGYDNAEDPDLIFKDLSENSIILTEALPKSEDEALADSVAPDETESRLDELEYKIDSVINSISGGSNVSNS